MSLNYELYKCSVHIFTCITYLRSINFWRLLCRFYQRHNYRARRTNNKSNWLKRELILSSTSTAPSAHPCRIYWFLQAQNTSIDRMQWCYRMVWLYRLTSSSECSKRDDFIRCECLTVVIVRRTDRYNRREFDLSDNAALSAPRVITIALCATNSHL